jgi:hypothetical protein
MLEKLRGLFQQGNPGSQLAKRLLDGLVMPFNMGGGFLQSTQRFERKNYAARFDDVDQVIRQLGPKLFSNGLKVGIPTARIRTERQDLGVHFGNALVDFFGLAIELGFGLGHASQDFIQVDKCIHVTLP